MIDRRTCVLAVCLLVAAAASAVDIDLGTSATTGAPDFRTAGVMAFGPNGVLFVADSAAAAIYAIDTGEQAAGHAAGKIDVEGIDRRIASMMGTTPDSVVIHDVAVNPVSRRAWLTVSRGAGADTENAIFTVGTDGEITAVDLSGMRHARANIGNAPAADAKDRRGGSLRIQAITDLAFIDDKLLVTGLSNEEFSSKLRAIDFPFSDVSPGTSVEIYHGAHGRWETYAPVRTFATYDVGTAPYVLAAYTCTPLVRFSLDDLKEAGGKVAGTTVAELGNRNRPLDMVIYTKGGQDYVLMANSARGVMKIELADLEDVDAIEARIADTAGLPYETISHLEGVEHLDRLGEDHALLLVGDDNGKHLRTVVLP
ncbi:MAG: hypothetical protein VYE73_17890 [Acidobacteriota bacterium]|nr:hypothetical protein [Acidobacteriota bacterium]